MILQVRLHCSCRACTVDEPSGPRLHSAPLLGDMYTHPGMHLHHCTAVDAALQHCLQDISDILMERVPRHLDVASIESKLMQVLCDSKCAAVAPAL
jgi:hypothetical protein